MNLKIRAVLFFFMICLASGCSDSLGDDNELKTLKDSLFRRNSDFSQLPVYADPPTNDYEEFGKGGFMFQLDSSVILLLNKYRKELETDIISRLDSGYSWVYLAAYLRYESAVPKLTELLLKCDRFYGWEGPDYSKIDSYTKDEQYCYQMAYIAAIEHITGSPVSEIIKLTDKEYNELKKNADLCTRDNIDGDSIYINCSALWLLQKLNRN